MMREKLPEKPFYVDQPSVSIDARAAGMNVIEIVLHHPEKNIAIGTFRLDETGARILAAGLIAAAEQARHWNDIRATTRSA